MVVKQNQNSAVAESFENFEDRQKAHAHMHSDSRFSLPLSLPLLVFPSFPSPFCLPLPPSHIPRPPLALKKKTISMDFVVEQQNFPLQALHLVDFGLLVVHTHVERDGGREGESDRHAGRPLELLHV